MASDRDNAKREIVARDGSDPELDSLIGSAHQLQLELAREANRHDEAKRKQDLGAFGKLLGGEKSAPTVVAMIVVIIGLGMAIGCLIMAGYQPEKAEFWSKQVERGIAIGSAALAYIFGKGSS